MTAQTVGGTATSYDYVLGRLEAATAGGATADYNYDPLGRLDTVTSGAQTLQSNTWDGFDNLTATSQLNAQSGSMDTTSYTYDSLNRRATQTTTGTGTTSFSYLGTSSEVASESDPGGVSKTYDYTPSGARLTQDTTTSGGSSSYGYYSYNSHSDVEAVTGPSGTTTATYGYTAYGNPVTSMFTGADKNDATSSSSSTTQPYSAYRFNAMRWDGTTGSYDMGFRNYDPGINQFTSRDMYDGATQDMGLTADPFTGSAYAFGDGNPVSNIENDGHMAWAGGTDTGGDTTSNCTVQGGSQMATSPPTHVSVKLGQSTVTGSTNRLNKDLQNATAWWNKQDPTAQCASSNGYSGPCNTAWLFDCVPGRSIWQGGCTPSQMSGQMTFVKHMCDADPQLACQQATFENYLGAVQNSGKSSGLYFPPDLAGAARDEGDGLTGPTCGQSFTPGTRVLLADGKTKPISQLKPGDKILATNTKTGKTSAETVTAVEVNHDHDLYDLHVKTAHGVTVIHTTSNHLFWDPYLHHWIPANKLSKNEHLQTANGVVAVVVGGTTPKQHDGWMWDLIVPGNNDHDFYVLAAPAGATAVNGVSAEDAPILVHNECLPALKDWTSQRYQFGNKQFLLDKSDMTHILSRHMPEFYDSSKPGTTTFFSSDMSISDVQDAISSVLQQNRDTLISRGTSSIYQIQGSYGGEDYVLGLNNGHIGQFYPGSLP